MILGPLWAGSMLPQPYIMFSVMLAVNLLLAVSIMLIFHLTLAIFVISVQYLTNYKKATTY